MIAKIKPVFRGIVTIHGSIWAATLFITIIRVYLWNLEPWESFFLLQMNSEIESRRHFVSLHCMLLTVSLCATPHTITVCNQVGGGGEGRKITISRSITNTSISTADFPMISPHVSLALPLLRWLIKYSANIQLYLTPNLACPTLVRELCHRIYYYVRTTNGNNCTFPKTN